MTTSFALWSSENTISNVTKYSFEKLSNHGIKFQMHGQKNCWYNFEQLWWRTDMTTSVALWSSTNMSNYTKDSFEKSSNHGTQIQMQVQKNSWYYFVQLWWRTDLTTSFALWSSTNTSNVTKNSYEKSSNHGIQIQMQVQKNSWHNFEQLW